MGQDAAAAGLARRPSLRPLRARQRTLALLIGGGLLVLTVGAGLDIGYHAGMPGLADEALGATGHLLTLVGMMLTTVAVALVAALRRRSRARPHH